MATPARRDPFTLQLPSLMSRLLDDRWFTDWFDASVDRPSPIRLEEYVDSGTTVIRAEIPDVDPDNDVDISVHDGVLHIRAERKEKSASTDKSFYRTEFRYGAFERTVPLPSGATANDVQATYKDGVLEVRVPTPSPMSETTKVTVQKAG